MLDSFATVSSVAAVSAQVASLQSSLLASTPQIIVGSTQPATTQQSYAWLRTVGGVPDALYFYTNSSWYTPLQFTIGQVSLFRIGSAMQVGWQPATDVSLTATAGFAWQEFTGIGLLVIGSIAYRKFSQSALSGTNA